MNPNLFWCIIGILGGAVLSFIISRYFYVKGLKKKILRYNIKTEIIINELYTNDIEELEIRYMSNRIYKLFVSRIEISNVGNCIIENHDFLTSQPLSISTNGLFINCKQDKQISVFNDLGSDIYWNFNEENNLITFEYECLSKFACIYLTLFHTGDIKINGILKNGKIISSDEFYKKKSGIIILFAISFSFIIGVLIFFFINMIPARIFF